MSNINSILEPSEEYCIGCGSCVTSCPKGAIGMGLDADGFIAPVLDQSLCVNCGMCKPKCIKYQKKDDFKLSDGQCFASITTSESIIKKSSSGGLGYELAHYAVEAGYEVWGAVYDKERRKAHHDVAHSVFELEKLQGSKYIQSDTLKVMGALSDGTISDKALFFGTPCQIAAFKNYQKKDGWIYVDLFCSGVPSYTLWFNYMDYICKKHRLSNDPDVLFRNKEYPWHDMYMTISDGHRCYTNKAVDDIFYTFFLSKLCFRDSCYKCRFKTEYADSDIRIGDFWGKRFSKNDAGVSLAVVNSDKGLEFIKGVEKKGFISVSDAFFNEVMEAQVSIYKDRSYKVDAMREMLRNHNIKYVYNKMVAPPLSYRVVKKVYHMLPTPLYKLLRRLRGYK